MDHPPTSEVRGTDAHEHDDSYEPSYSPVIQQPTVGYSASGSEIALLRRQVELLERMVFSSNPQPRSTNFHRKLTDIYLPEYDPDINQLTIQEWCKQVDSLILLRGCSQEIAMMKALSCLRGRAKKWADANAHALADWTAIKTHLLSQFSAETRYITFVNRFRDYTSNDAETYAEYVSEAWRLFSRISPNAPVDLMVEAVISGIRPKFYQAELLRSMPKTQAELIATLTNYRKRSAVSSAFNEATEPKRPRTDTSTVTNDSNRIRCNKCGRNGHRAQDCKTPFCNTCKRTGHHSDKCWSKISNNTARFTTPTWNQSSRATPQASHQPTRVAAPVPSQPAVNVVERETPCRASIRIGNTELTCLIDTGAECSLIKRKSSGSIPGKRFNKFTQLRGIGGHLITSNEVVETTVTLDEVTFETTLHVVDNLPYDVILGVDSLQIPGIKIEITNNEISVKREHFVGQIKIDPFQSTIDTDISDKTLLEKTLSKHSSIFGINLPSKIVKTGCLKIRLKDQHRVVNRRPYRLAPIEREKVKSIVQDLKSKGIIRDSCSPYASPILLVKKKNGEDRLCVDFRELNSNTVRDHYPLPLIQDQIDKLATAKFFTTLDMESGFHQIPIAEESIEKTAFVTPDGQIISDREPAIMGGEIQNFFQSGRIEHHAIARGVPRANGQIERLMRTLRDHLGVIALNHSKAWISKLGELQLCINTTKSKATGHSPLELLIGKEMKMK
ncbi:uncharacterized protein [Choristoneura fumiferana]|uniref:uncharacterized protein n=1 Tax=Choristoneura fumiferana TaxID=7141 RepID=UPI003D1556A7